MNLKRIVLATLALWVFGMVWTMLTCGWLFNWVYEIEPVIWKTPAEMVSTATMAGSALVELVGNFLFVFIYVLLSKYLPIKKPVQRGMVYGLGVYLVGPFSGFIGMPFYMTISTMVVGYWVINMLISYVLMGAITGKICKGK